MIAEIALVVALLALVAVTTLLFRRNFLGSGRTDVSVHVTLDRIRQVGELTVLKAYIKEVVTMTTEADSKFTSTGKILLICGFDIEFRYDLRKIKIGRTEQGDIPEISLPPHFIRVVPIETQFYDERKSAWLGLIPKDFSVDERNDLLREARDKAVEQAGLLQGDLQEKVRVSAKTTLTALAEAFGVTKVAFTFEESASVVRQINEQLIKTAA
jgi:hypothetical protein